MKMAPRSKIAIGLILTATVLLVLPADAGFQIRSAPIAGKRYLLLRDVAAFYGMKYRAGKDTALLTSKYSRLKFYKNLRKSTINGVQVHLSDAIGKWRNELAVSETDFRLVLEPILRSRTLRPRTIKRIVIDPGHGGRDPGAQNSHDDEKKITLAVARELYSILKRCGYKVTLTRTGDHSRSLRQRATAGGQAKADIFISLHTNSAAARHVKGVETYLLTPEGTSSTYSNSKKDTASPGNAYDEENTRLAYEIQKEVVTTTG
ncbi:MAG: N-acetylmuramoyl-L-alanine amidase, partial [Lentisphaeria bacterium]